MAWLFDLSGADDPLGGVDQDGERDPFEAVDEVGDLGDLDELAVHLFDVWFDSAERRWAAYAWDALTRAGLINYDDETERTLVVCRLVVLAGINREFAARAFDEGCEGEWDAKVAGVGFEGEHPLLDRLALGRLAERLGVIGDGGYADEREQSSRLVVAIARNEWDRVCTALIEELGEDGLFASLRLSPKAATRYPLPDEVRWQALNDDLDGMGSAYLWLCDGLPQ